MLSALLLLDSSMWGLWALARLYFPAFALAPVNSEALAVSGVFSELEGLLAIAFSALLCTASRMGTIGAIHSVAIAHLMEFAALLYLWPSAIAAGYEKSFLSSGLAYNTLMGLLLLSCATAAPGKRAPKPSAQYGFTMLLSTLCFALALVAFAAPVPLAQALGYASAVSAALNLQVQMASFVLMGLSAVLCANARTCSRQFSLGFSSACLLSVLWCAMRHFKTGGVLYGTTAAFGAVQAFIALYYLLNLPPLAGGAVKSE